MKKDLVAVVLAGGAGNRFWPLTTNKIVFPFFGKPLVEHTVNSVLPKQVKRLVIVTSQVNDNKIRNLKYPVPHVTVIQQTPNGMAGALLSAESELRGVSLLIINGDDITGSQLYSSVTARAQSAAVFGVIPAWKPLTYFPGGYLRMNGERVVEICEKPGAGNEPSPYAIALGHFLEDSDVFMYELKRTKSQNDDVYERTLSLLMGHERFVAEVFADRFASLKYPWHVLDAMEILFGRLRAHRGKNVQIKENVQIEGDVYIGDGVRIFENTKISGPCYIGPGTIVGNNNIIRHSHLGSGCVTGFNTDITRSYIGDNCWFHSNYIGDSVLENNVSMGSGTVLANLRLDEGEVFSVVKGVKTATGRTKLGAIIGSNVRMGVNVSVMPGVKIGSNTFIGAGSLVNEDIVSDSYYAVKVQPVIRKNNKTASPDRSNFKKQL